MIAETRSRVTEGLRGGRSIGGKEREEMRKSERNTHVRWGQGEWYPMRHKQEMVKLRRRVARDTVACRQGLHREGHRSSREAVFLLLQKGEPEQRARQSQILQCQAAPLRHMTEVHRILHGEHSVPLTKGMLSG